MEDNHEQCCRLLSEIVLTISITMEARIPFFESEIMSICLEDKF